MKSKTKTEIFEAVTKVNAKHKQNWMIIELSYSTKLVLPYDAGVQFMTSLKDAEILEEGYSKPTKIIPIEKEAFRTSLLGHAHYEDIKVAQLLNISVDELKEARNPVQETETA